MEKYIIIFSGYNQRAVIAFLRILRKNNIDKYMIIASSHNDPIFLTKYKNKVGYIRKDKALSIELFKRIALMIPDAKELLILPSTEALNRFILKNKLELFKLKYEIPLVERKLYEVISDKLYFAQLCKENRFDVPQALNLGSDYETPFVAKPKHYTASDGKNYSPVLVKSKVEFRDFIETYPIDDFIIQEYVFGDSYYLLYYFAKNGEIFEYSQQNIAQQPQGKSILAALPANIHNMEISNRYKELLKNLSFQGFIMIELRKTKDTFYMIEANPRLWGPSQLFVDAGINFFDVFLFEYGYLEKMPLFACDDTIRYLWTGGIVQTVERGKKIITYDNLDKDWYKQREWQDWDIYNRDDTNMIYRNKL